MRLPTVAFRDRRCSGRTRHPSLGHAASGLRAQRFEGTITLELEHGHNAVGAFGNDQDHYVGADHETGVESVVGTARNVLATAAETERVAIRIAARL